MKILLFILLFPLLAHAQKPVASAKQNTLVNTPGFVINGLVEGLPDSTMVFLINPAEPNNTVAVGYSKKGAFTLKGKVTRPDIYQISFKGLAAQAGIFLENHTFTLSGSVKTFDKLQISGSTFQADYQLYETRFNPIKNRLNALNATIQATAPGNQRDSLIGLFEGERKKLVIEIDAFVKQKPASPVTAYILWLTSRVGGDVQELEGRYNKLTAAAKNSVYAKRLESVINEANSPKIGAEGTMAVDFSQADTANKPVKLSSFKGRYVLVDFWASWCRPCRMENPAVVNAFNTFKSKNFTILSVSLDQSRANWLKAISDDNLNWTHVSDLKYWQNEAALLYGVQSIPSNMLIDPSGKIIARDLRGEALYGMLERIFK